MTVSEQIREQVRTRANFTCEYCGVTETDSAGLLTVDHFRPQAQAGPDTLDNLVYACYRCNGYKADYWPTNPDAPRLWHPRSEEAETHFVELADGTLYARTPVGAFTIVLLHLNRLPLVAFRLQRLARIAQQRQSEQFRNILALLIQTNSQQAELQEEHRALLDQQRRILQTITEEQSRS